MKLIRKNPVLSLAEMIGSAVTDSFYNVSYKGAENIPKKGPALVVPKHLSYLDIVFEGIFLKRHCSRYSNWIMKSGLTDALKYLGGIKVIRNQDIEKIQDPGKKAEAKYDASVFNKKTLDYCRWLYQQGEILVVHAEGTRTRNRVAELDKGMLVFTKRMERKLKTEIPVVPLGIEYENLLLPGSKVYLRAGNPLSAKNKNLADAVQKEIKKLSGLD